MGELFNTTATSHMPSLSAEETRHLPAALVYPVLTPFAPSYSDSILFLLTKTLSQSFPSQGITAFCVPVSYTHLDVYKRQHSTQGAVRNKSLRNAVFACLSRTWTQSMTQSLPFRAGQSIPPYAESGPWKIIPLPLTAPKPLTCTTKCA